MTQMLPSAQRGTRTAHQVVVTAVEALTPNMRRITFEGEALARMSMALPAQWLKVVLPGSEEAPVSRTYTIRRFYPGWRAMDVDFVLHGETGPASSWARQARIGDRLRLGEPRGGVRLIPEARWRLLAGDETALPAIASLLDAIPHDSDVPMRVVIEVASAAEAQPLPVAAATEVRWLPRDGSGDRPGSVLEACVCGLPLPTSPGQIFLAGEAMAVRTMKDSLARRAPRAGLEAKGYRRLGHADHRDRA